MDSPKPKSGTKAKALGKSSAGSRTRSKGPGSAKEDSNLSNHRSASSSTVEGNEVNTKSSENGGEEHADDSSTSTTEHVLQREEKLLQVLCGSLEDLPPLSSKIVRIFTSSTFTGK